MPLMRRPCGAHMPLRCGSSARSRLARAFTKFTRVRRPQTKFCRCRPAFDKSCPIGTYSGQFSPILGPPCAIGELPCRHRLLKPCPVDALVVEAWANLGRFWPASGPHRPELADTGPNLAHLDLKASSDIDRHTSDRPPLRTWSWWSRTHESGRSADTFGTIQKNIWPCARKRPLVEQTPQTLPSPALPASPAYRWVHRSGQF